MSDNPRIIFTVTNDLSYDQRMIRICTSLATAGYRVRLVGRQRSSSKPLVNQPFEQKRLKCWFEKGKFFYLEYNIRLFLFLFFVKYDAIGAVDLDTILPGLLVSRLKGKKIIYDAHEYFTETPEVVRRPGIKRIWEAVARFAIPRVDAAMTVGARLAEIMSQQYNKTFEVIHNVPFRQHEIAQPIKNIILYQGVLNEGRGLEQAIEAMSFIENAELWLAGEGDLSEVLRQKAIDLQLENKIKFLGYIPPSELRNITLQAKIGLNLLENRGLSYYYSLANKCFDYIQAGLPSIQMHFPEYQQLNKERAVFILLHDLKVELLIHAIQRLLNEEALYHGLRQNCLILKEIYIWEKEEKKLIDLFQRFLPLDKSHLNS